MSEPHAGVAQAAEQRFYKPTRESEPLGVFNGYKGFSFVILAGGGWREVYGGSQVQLRAQ
jgi:hypothetical protein